MIHFACQTCGKVYKVPEEFAGRNTKCRACGQPLQVPLLPAEVSDSNQISLPQFELYSDTQAKALLSQLSQISRFAEVAEWDSNAEHEVGQIRSYLEQLSSYELRLDEVERRSMAVHAQEGFFKRIFGSYPKKTEITSGREFAVAARSSLEKLANELEGAIDKIPNSPEEQKEMVKELRILKKELNQQKREINEVMRHIRTEARQKSAWVAFGTPTSRRLQRLFIRLRKEGALESHEDSKSEIEKQLMVVERTILWIERFK